MDYVAPDFRLSDDLGVEPMACNIAFVVAFAVAAVVYHAAAIWNWALAIVAAAGAMVVVVGAGVEC
jgi:hypothetical protein